MPQLRGLAIHTKSGAQYTGAPSSFPAARSVAWPPQSNTASATSAWTAPSPPTWSMTAAGPSTIQVGSGSLSEKSAYAAPSTGPKAGPDREVAWVWSM